MYARILFSQIRGSVIQLLAVAALFVLGLSTTVSAQDIKPYQPNLTAERPLMPLLSARNPLDGTRGEGRDTLMTIGGPRAGRPAPARARATTRKAAQVPSDASRSIDYSGPRFGFTYLPKAIVDSLANHNIKVGSTISQFGWQLEREIHVSPEGPMVLNEWVFLAGGLDRGVFLPSLTWLVGARSKTGNEVGFGPNVSLSGVGLALAAGVTVNSGGLHLPMNIAAASSRGGIRISFLTGFSLH